MITIETGTLPNGTSIEAVRIADPADLVAVRDSEWADGQVKLLTFATAAPVAYVGTEPPLSMTARVAVAGSALVKGPAGDIEVWTGAMLDAALAAGGDRA